MTNLQVVLLKLFEPVMDITFSKVSSSFAPLWRQIDKVDPEYFRTSKRVNVTDETKIKATKEEADDYYSSAMEGGSSSWIKLTRSR
jgi:ubiquitin conjugation factor E4 B